MTKFTLFFDYLFLFAGERNYGSAVDMWGAGCIMAEMWTRVPILQVSPPPPRPVVRILYGFQCCGSVIFWYGSGCESGLSDPYLCRTDLDADPGGPKTYGSNGSRSGTVVKGQKKSQNSRYYGFLTIFA